LVATGQAHRRRPGRGDRFGTAVALNQDYAAVGAPDDDGALGAVYIFERSGTAWSQVDKLTRPTGVADDAFGTSVAMRGDQLLVGAPGRDGARGAVYLYERSGATWVPLVTYTASDAAAGDRFGAGVAIGDGEAVVGAPSAVVARARPTCSPPSNSTATATASPTSATRVACRSIR
jgi:hypothetical protein